MPFDRRLGAHLPVSGGLLRAAARAIEIGATTAQLFSDNPTAWQRRAEPPGELPRFRERLAACDVAPLTIHASYLVNLAGPDATFFERSVELLRHELQTAVAYGARFVNVHAGSHGDAGLAAGIERLASGVRRALDGASLLPPAAGGPVLVLENSAGGGFGVGASIEELERIAEACARQGVAEGRLAFCLDTAHLWGAGVPIDDERGVDGLVREVRERLGLERLVLVHLNDSKAERGSRADRHEHVGAGRIGEAGMRAILTHPGLAHVAYVIETPGMDEGYDALNLARARAIAAGEAPEPLPPEAFSLRGSRAAGARAAGARAARP